MTVEGSAHSKVTVKVDPEEVASEAARLFVGWAREAEEAERPFRVALSGGSTPKLLYRRLVSDYKGEVDWGRIEWFVGDERWVPPTHAESNYKLAKSELFSKVEVDPRKIFPVPYAGYTPVQAAMEYEETICRTFEVEEGNLPRFDVIFLGLGDDGHTASLFPYTEALHEEERFVTANYVDKLETHRITLTAPVLKAAREVLFMIAGEGKCDALREVLEGSVNIERYPGQILREAKGKVTWLVDEAAAADLDEALEG